MKKRKVTLIKIIGLVLVVIFGIVVIVNVMGHDNRGEGIDKQQETSKESPIKLTDQQIGILAGLAIDQKWLTAQLDADQLIYGVVKPSDVIPEGVNKDESFLLTPGDGQRFIYFFVNSDQELVIQAGKDDRIVRKKKLSLKQLTKKFYQTPQQKRRVNELVSKLRTE